MDQTAQKLAAALAAARGEVSTAPPLQWPEVAAVLAAEVKRLRAMEARARDYASDPYCRGQGTARLILDEYGD